VKSHYGPRQVSWCLRSTVVILARLVTAWFVQRDGKAGSFRSNNILCGGVPSIVTVVHTAHTVCITEKCYCIR
jgi:hypothetical protein